MKMKKRRFLIGIWILSALCLMGCRSSANEPEGTKEPNEGVAYEKGVDFVGALKAVDTDSGTMEFYNTSFDCMETYQYSGGTHILTKNDKEMAAGELEPGEVYDVYTSEDGSRIVKMKQSAEVTEHEGVSLSVNTGEKRLTVRDVNYAYTDNLLVFSEGKQIDPMEITAEDQVTFRGAKGQAYSVTVTRGHGYIRPTHCKDFAGGTVTVRGEAILPVSTDMLLIVPEGTQLLSMVNGDLTAEASVQVERGQVTEVNMEDYQSQVPDTARVRFDINPEGAELYINGSLMDPSKRISLNYGNHSIKVVLEGYNDYSGIINIQDASPTVRIDLAEETAEVVTEDEDSSSSVTEEEDSSGSTADAATYDKNHTITVSAPSGAAVYVDGTYKGEAPCSFTKVIGSVTLTLTKEGYETKSYRVEISDDSKDVSWSFPDLEEKSDG